MTTRDAKKDISKTANNSKKPTKKSNVSSGTSKEESLSNLSAIMATEKDTTVKRLTKAVSDRIESLKSK